MSPVTLGALYSVALFLSMLGLLEVGRRLGARARLEGVDPGSGTVAVEGAVFALLGLIIAFSFSGAATRLDARRDQIVEETNAIGTAWLRLDLLPAEALPALRASFRDYLDARIAGYKILPDLEASEAFQKRATELQAQIWSQATAATRSPEAATGAAVLLLPALNEMFDITTTRALATRQHPPAAVYVLLYILALAAAFFAGFGMSGTKKHPMVHSVGFAAVIAFTVYVTIDFEYPRMGFLRIDDFDAALIEVRASMK